MQARVRDPFGNSASNWLADNGFNFMEIAGRPSGNPRRNQGTGMLPLRDGPVRASGQTIGNRYIGNIRPPSGPNQAGGRESIMRSTGEWATRGQNPGQIINSGAERPVSRSNVYSQEVNCGNFSHVVLDVLPW